MDRTCLFVICAAPLARRAPDIARALVDAGWTVQVAATASAADGWVDRQEIERITGSPVRSTYRAPEQPRTRSQPDAVLLCPATFNTIGKLANGIADEYALSALSEAIGAGVRMVVVPMINESLWKHPALQANLNRLAGAGVIAVDPTSLDATLRPVRSGTGDSVAEALDVAALAQCLSELDPSHDTEPEEG